MEEKFSIDSEIDVPPSVDREPVVIVGRLNFRFAIRFACLFLLILVLTFNVDGAAWYALTLPFLFSLVFIESKNSWYSSSNCCMTFMAVNQKSEINFDMDAELQKN